MSSESNKFNYSDLLGTIVLIVFFSRFFLNSFIGIKEIIEIIFGIGLSIYLFNNNKSKVAKKEQPEIEKSRIEKNFPPTTFSSSKRLFATTIDFVILSFIFGFSFDYLSHYISEGIALSVSFTAIFIILYSLIQFKNWGSLNWLFKKQILKNNGFRLSYSDFFLRTLQKLIVVFAYGFMITFIIFPPMKYFDEGLTPVDVFSETRETDSSELEDY